MATNRARLVAREGIRRKFRPTVTRLLLIGESPPWNRTFFYYANSNLYCRTVEAFTQAKLVARDSTQFLDDFRNLGCFLDDLSHTPINQLRTAQRRTARDRAVRDLESRLRLIRPGVIVCVMKGIERDVRRAIESADMHEKAFCAVPFPSHGHQRQYMDQLANILSKLGPSLGG